MTADSCLGVAELVQALRDTVDDLEDRLGTDGASPPSRTGLERT